MCNKHIIEAVKRMMRDFCENDYPFADKVIIQAGRLMFALKISKVFGQGYAGIC